MKLTTTEKRAKALCEAIKSRTENGGTYPVNVEWVKSSTWGTNPRIMHHGEKTTNVSGCGYCKHSTALADALRWLGEDDASMREIWSKGGCGVSSVTSALLEAGYVLEYVTGTKMTDVYIIRKA
jgi:hypothetical protein